MVPITWKGGLELVCYVLLHAYLEIPKVFESSERGLPEFNFKSTAWMLYPPCRMKSINFYYTVPYCQYIPALLEINMHTQVYCLHLINICTQYVYLFFIYPFQNVKLPAYKAGLPGI